MDPSYKKFEQVWLPFPDLHDLNCDRLRFLMTSLPFWPMRSSTHHQSGTAPQNTIASIEKQTIHFIEWMITDKIVWNLPQPPISLMTSSSWTLLAVILITIYVVYFSFSLKSFWFRFKSKPCHDKINWLKCTWFLMSLYQNLLILFTSLASMNCLKCEMCLRT